MIFELINPSDKTTLEADSLAVAAFSAILVCPRYGVSNIDNPEEKFFEFFGAVDAFTEKFGNPITFLENHDEEVAACLESFAYLSADERRRYFLAMELIDDPEKRKKFRDEHEDKSRSSMNKICKAAWEYAGAIRRKIAKKGGK